MRQFYETLFNTGEGVCIGTSVYDTAIRTFTPDALPIGNFVSINPMHTSRADANVTQYRNILCEFDQGSRAEQLAAIAGMPASTIVSSGGKSIHAIISLAEAMPAESAYRALVHSIYTKLPTVDKSGKNPSRFTRVPGVLRVETGQFQELLYNAGRVPLAALEAWLGSPISTEAHAYADEGPSSRSSLRRPNQWTNYFLMFGAETPAGMWNVELFKAACDLARCGKTAEEIVETLNGVTGHLDRADMKTINSAIKTARRAY